MSRIVLAEDQPHLLHVLSLWLQRNGHAVSEAANGQLALAALRGGPHDVLITDVNMPELDGLALTAHAVREFPNLRAIFLITSRANQHDLAARFSDPRVCIHPKPFSPSQLVAEVDRCLAVRGGWAGVQ